MFDVAISICKEGLDFLLKKQQINREHKDRIANLLEEISQVLVDTSEKLKNNVYPHGNCHLLEGLTIKLTGYLQNSISNDDLTKLVDILRESAQVERLFSVKDDPETIPTIERAAGEFKLMSMLLKI